MASSDGAEESRVNLQEHKVTPLDEYRWSVIR